MVPRLCEAQGPPGLTPFRSLWTGIVVNDPSQRCPPGQCGERRQPPSRLCLAIVPELWWGVALVGCGFLPFPSPLFALPPGGGACLTNRGKAVRGGWGSSGPWMGPPWEAA